MIKRFFYLNIVCFFSVASLSAMIQNDELFSQANELYNQDKFQEAIANYKSILDRGQESAALYYNLANAHYKVNNIAQSIFYYEKALQLSPNDPDIKNNLAFAKNATIDVIDVIPEGFLSRTINNITNAYTFDTWAWIAVFFVITFVILFLVYQRAFTSLRKRIFFVSAMLCFLFAISALIFAYKQYSFIQNNQYAIIFSQESIVKSEPNLRSEQVFELHAGTKVRVTETVNNWKKIRLADGKIGWIPAEDLREL